MSMSGPQRPRRAEGFAAAPQHLDAGGSGRKLLQHRRLPDAGFTGDHREAALDPRQRQRSRQLRERRVTLQQCHRVP
jgi:hypothetical protein